jgi:hypothetical protein
MDTAMAEATRNHQLDVPAAALGVGVASAALGKLLGALAETALYAAWFAVLGRALPFGAVWVWLVSLSLLDTFGTVATGFAPDLDGVVRAVVGVLCNGRLLLAPDVYDSHVLAPVLSGFSVFAALRIVSTAWVLARATERRLGGALAMTLGAWASTRGLIVALALVLRGHGGAAGVSS